MVFNLAPLNSLVLHELIYNFLYSLVIEVFNGQIFIWVTYYYHINTIKLKYHITTRNLPHLKAYTCRCRRNIRSYPYMT